MAGCTPPGGLCYPSPMPPIAPQAGLYPWIVIHPCSTAPGSPKARLAKRGGQGCFGEGSSRAGPEVLVWGAQLELNQSQVVWRDRRVTIWETQRRQAEHSQPSPSVFLVCSSPSYSAAKTSAAIVKLKMGSIFTATLFRSSELNRRGRVIIGAGMSALIEFDGNNKQKGERWGRFCLLYTHYCCLM